MKSHLAPHMELYSQQVYATYCGAACTQMVLNQFASGLGVGGPNNLIDQQVLLSNIVNRRTIQEPDIAWTAPPDGIQATLNNFVKTYYPSDKRKFTQITFKEDELNQAVRCACWSIKQFGTPVIFLTYGYFHWIVIYGFTSEGATTDSAGHFKISSFDVYNPWPPKSANIDGFAFANVSSNLLKWEEEVKQDRQARHTLLKNAVSDEVKLSREGRSYWKGKHVIICDSRCEEIKSSFSNESIYPEQAREAVRVTDFKRDKEIDDSIIKEVAQKGLNDTVLHPDYYAPDNGTPRDGALSVKWNSALGAKVAQPAKPVPVYFDPNLDGDSDPNTGPFFGDVQYYLVPFRNKQDELQGIVQVSHSDPPMYLHAVTTTLPEFKTYSRDMLDKVLTPEKLDEFKVNLGRERNVPPTKISVKCVWNPCLESCSPCLPYYKVVLTEDEAQKLPYQSFCERPYDQHAFERPSFEWRRYHRRRYNHYNR